MTITLSAPSAGAKKKSDALSVSLEHPRDHDFLHPCAAAYIQPTSSICKALGGEADGNGGILDV